MTDAPKIKIARSGKILGEFTMWEASQQWIAGGISMNDDYWRSGMASWGKLLDIKAEILAAKKPELIPVEKVPATPSAPVPPLPPSKPVTDDGLGAGKVSGTIFFIIGIFTLISSLAGDATGSAIRQGVLAQHMTNGILLMILGVLLSKR